MGYQQASRCFHLPYALVVLPEGKMSHGWERNLVFETTAGNV